MLDQIFGVILACISEIIFALIIIPIISLIDDYLFNKKKLLGALILVLAVGLLKDIDPDFSLIFIVILLLMFSWNYYHEFLKPKDKRDYEFIAGSFGFMLGASIPLIEGWKLGVIVLGSICGSLFFNLMWRLIVYSVGDKYPYLKTPTPEEPSNGDNHQD